VRHDPEASARVAVELALAGRQRRAEVTSRSQ